MTVHNLSSKSLSTAELTLLSKGLTFSPSPKISKKDRTQLIHNFGTFSHHIRQLYSINPNQNTPIQISSNSISNPLFRKMPLLSKSTITPQPYCNPLIENYIIDTKELLLPQLPHLFHHDRQNLNQKETKAIKLLHKNHNVTVKPADKNLGIVIMNTNDYLDLCLTHLSSTTYKPTERFPDSIRRNLENTIIDFKLELLRYKPRLYKILLPPKIHRIPRFYGLPKLHKTPNEKGLPPLRPIVSHTNSLLSNSAKFIDHVLQPLARSYPDYLHNSTTLISTLSTTQIQNETILISMDVNNLFPSIPITECLKIIYNEMISHQHLLIFDPNLIIRLLHLNLTNNYFEFANFNFQQTTGIAMGAAFSPTVANIFMSSFFQQFLKTTNNHPVLLTRYIDDVFIIWPKKFPLAKFITAINQFHPNIKFTTSSSDLTINYLDLTIYKGKLFEEKQLLDIKTYQKPRNLYQYLHFTSHHPKSNFKSIVIGECIRYIRTNTDEENYKIQTKLLHIRLQARNYPNKFLIKHINSLDYQNRPQYLTAAPQQHHIETKPRPLFKCLPPPQLKQLKKITLHNYRSLQPFLGKPHFILFQHKTLQDLLVNSKYNPSDTDIIDIHLTCQNDQTTNTQLTQLELPTIPAIQPKTCNHPRCSTCRHYNTKNFFKSTTTKQHYRIRHNFTCNSANIIYLFTCKKCKKQYVGKTTKPLKQRINHHRSTILSKEQRYISVHFNFPDHNIDDIQVQAIDRTSPNKLEELERYWINTLQTVKPKGLNYI